MATYVLAAAVVAVTVIGWPGAVIAQSAKGPSGHWEGAIDVPGQPLAMEVDLAPTGDTWEGTLNIPGQGLKGFPLSGVTVQGETVAFAMKGVPGDPQFSATLSKDGKTLSGELKQGGGSVPFSLTRTGDARIERPPASTPVTKEIEGSWEATLDADGTRFRLVVKLANQAGGAASGTLISVDQGGTEIPIGTVVQSGSHLRLVVPAVIGNYEGDLKDGQLTGTWTQGPRSWPLVFTRPK